MTKRIYIYTNVHGQGVHNHIVSDFNGRAGLLEYAYNETAMTGTSINNRMTIDEICDALQDKGVGGGCGARSHSRVSRRETEKLITQGAINYTSLRSR